VPPDPPKPPLFRNAPLCLSRQPQQELVFLLREPQLHAGYTGIARVCVDANRRRVHDLPAARSGTAEDRADPLDELLLRLAREPERVFTKAELLRDVWGYRASARTRTLDSHASRLRRKLRDAGTPVALVENVWGVGYRLLGVVPLDV